MSDIPSIKRSHKGLVWDESLVEFVRNQAIAGVLISDVAAKLGIDRRTLYEHCRKLDIYFTQHRYDMNTRRMVVIGEEIAEVTGSDGSDIAPERQLSGVRPLPPGHSLSWGVISHGAQFEPNTPFFGKRRV